MDTELNLFDFGTNEHGEYVNLVEEEKLKNEMQASELEKWINSHENPLIRLADFMFCGYEWDNHLLVDIPPRLEEIVKTKCYHYGNMDKGLYIFSMYDKEDDRYILVFENNKHYLIFNCTNFYFNENRELTDYSLKDYLLGKTEITFAALHCPCFDLNGNHIEQYADGEQWQQDIRHIVCIKEWQMNKYGHNRMQRGKKIKDFYEVEFTLPQLIEFWGESDTTKNRER